MRGKRIRLTAMDRQLSPADTRCKSLSGIANTGPIAIDSSYSRRWVIRGGVGPSVAMPHGGQGDSVSARITALRPKPSSSSSSDAAFWEVDRFSARRPPRRPRIGKGSLLLMVMLE